jgi:Tfp pilus assembly protein PilO
MRSKRAPLIAGAAAAALCLLLIFFLVTPKLSDVSAAKDRLAEEQNQTQVLLSQKAALEDAKRNAPEARAKIQEVNQRIPKVADQQGLLLNLSNAALASGIAIVSLTPSTPAFDPATGLTNLDISVSATGTYFELADYMYRIETFPRAGKVLNLSISGSAGAASGIPELTASFNLQFYTTDTSAGPGSVPGPTTEAPAEA